MFLVRRIDHWLEESYNTITDAGLGLFRICYSLYLLLFGINSYAQGIVSNPENLYDPPLSIAFFFDLPSLEFFIFLDWLVLLSIPFVLFGLFTKPASFVLGFGFLLGNSFLYSFGKIDHGRLLQMLVPLLFSFSNWERRFSIDSNRKKIESPRYYLIAIYALLIGLAMFSAGIEKVFGGWLNWENDSLRYILIRDVVYERIGLLGKWASTIKSSLFWKAMDYSVVAFELGALLAAFRLKWMKWWAFLAVHFHIGVYLLLGFSFKGNFICYLIFVNWFLLSESTSNNVVYRLDTFFRSVKSYWVFVVVIGIGLLKLIGIKSIMDFVGINSSNTLVFISAFVISTFSAFEKL